MPTLTSSLIVKLIDGISAPAKAAARSLSGIGNAAKHLNGVGGAMAGRLAASSAETAKRLDAVRGRMLEAAATGYTLAHALTAPVKAAMEFESAMADVRKVVDFSSDNEFKAFSDEILKMSTRIPMAAKGFATLVANAGQAGIAKEEIQGFAEMASKVAVAFDIAAERAGEDLAKLKTGLGISVQRTGLLADAMNHLSNAMASSAPDILDVVRRVGAQSKQFGFNEIQVSAFASAMLSAGAESDVAATSFRNMGTRSRAAPARPRPSGRLTPRSASTRSPSPSRCKRTPSERRSTCCNGSASSRPT